MGMTLLSSYRFLSVRVALRALMIRCLPLCTNGKHHDQHVTSRSSDEDLPQLRVRVRLIDRNQRKWVVKRQDRVLKAHAMLPPVSSCFDRVPFEAEPHIYSIYCFSMPRLVESVATRTRAS